MKRPRKTLIYNSEDSRDEMMRRAGAYAEQHNLTPEMIATVAKNLHFQSGVDDKLVFATQVGTDVKWNDALVAKTITYIKDHEIEVIILDPLVSLHAVTENDNGPMDKVADIFKFIQGETGVCDVDCAPHPENAARSETGGQRLARRGRFHQRIALRSQHQRYLDR